MDTWKNSNVTGDLTQIPGVGPAAATLLEENGIANSFMLFGKYLSLKGPDANSYEPAIHNDKFWYWLQEIGIKSHRSAVVAAIGEKMAQTFPGIYDPASYDE